MKINNNIKNLNNNMNFSSIKLGDKAVQRICDASKINSVGQRAIIGATALFLQPAINMSNKNVDKKTREQSAIRSVARAIIGTATGIAVRAATIAIANKYAGSGKFLDFTQNVAQDGKKIVENLSKATQDQKRNYGATMGTLLGLVVMLFTNFLVDAPLINVLQNKLENVFNKHKEQKLNKQNEEADNVSSK